MNRKMKRSLLSVAISSALLSPCFAGAVEYIAPPEGVEPASEQMTNRNVEENVWFDYSEVTSNDATIYKNGVVLNNGENHANSAGIWMTASGDENVKSTAVEADQGVFTNKGSIYVDGSRHTKSWETHAIWVRQGAEAVNEGIIAVKNAYGMQAAGKQNGDAEDAGSAKLVNNGTISVEGTGVAMELAGANAKAEGVNNGTIILNTPVDSGFSVGVLFKEVSGNTFTNSGDIIVASGAKGISVESVKAAVTNEGTIVAAEGGAAISVTGDDSGLDLTLKGASHIEGDVTLNERSTLLVENLANRNEVLQLTNDSLSKVEMANSALAISGDDVLNIASLKQDGNSTLGLTGTRTLKVASLESDADLAFDHKLTDDEVEAGKKLLQVDGNESNHAVNVRMASQVTDTLSGAEEARELVAKQIDVAGDTATTTTTFAEGTVLGTMTAIRTGQDGEIVMTEAKNTGTEALQKI
ncbi:hypothetical protein NAI82_10210, partial [Oxalobacter sp. JAC-2022]